MNATVTEQANQNPTTAAGQVLPDMLVATASSFRNAMLKLNQLSTKRDAAYAKMRALTEEMTAATTALGQGKDPERDPVKIAQDLKRAHAAIDRELEHYYAACRELTESRDRLVTSITDLQAMALPIAE